MKNKCCVGILAILLVSTFDLASAFRCGSDLVALGDHSFQVSGKCGPPISKEVVGYTLSKNRKRELKMEHWVYGPKAGVYHVLVFEGGILTKVFDFRAP